MSNKKKKSKRRVAQPEVPDPTPTVTAPSRPSSPFYPAMTPVIQPSPPTPPPAPHQTHAAKPHLKKTKAAASWIVQVLVVAIPAGITGYFGREGIKTDAATSYETVVTALKELQVATKEMAANQSYLQGEIDTLRNDATRWHGTKTMPRPKPPPTMKSEVTISTIPADLNTALKDKGQPKAQEVISLAIPKEVFTPEEKKVLDDAKKKREEAAAAAEKAAVDKAGAASPRHEHGPNEP